MVDMSLISGTVTSLKFAGDIAKGFLDLKTFNEVGGKVAELQSAILSAQISAIEANAAQFAMIEEIRALKEEMTRIKAWDTQKQHYKLTPLWANASVAYALKESMASGEPPHLICTKCYEDGRKSILNPLTLASHHIVFSCPICKSQIPTGDKGEPQIQYAPD